MAFRHQLLTFLRYQSFYFLTVFLSHINLLYNFYYILHHDLSYLLSLFFYQIFILILMFIGLPGMTLCYYFNYFFLFYNTHIFIITNLQANFFSQFLLDLQTNKRIYHSISTHTYWSENKRSSVCILSYTQNYQIEI